MPTTDQARLKSPEFRGSYVYLTKPRENKEDPTKKPRYSITLVLPKDKPATKAFIKSLEKMFQTAMQEKLGKVIPFSATKHYPIRDGDVENEDGEVSDITAGCWVMKASSVFKPDVIDKHGDAINDESELYSGAWYKVVVQAYAWKNDKGGKGVSIDLKNVMKVKDDERYGGGKPARDDFADDIENGGDSDDDDTPAPKKPKGTKQKSAADIFGDDD